MHFMSCINFIVDVDVEVIYLCCVPWCCFVYLDVDGACIPSVLFYAWLAPRLVYMFVCLFVCFFTHTTYTNTNAKHL